MNSPSSPLATLLLLTYNQAPFIGEAIASALAQNHPQLEILIVDDGSTDGTAEAIDAALSAHPLPSSLRVVRRPAPLGALQNLVTSVRELVRTPLVIYQAGDDCSLPQRAQRTIELWLQFGAPTYFYLHGPVWRVAADGREGLWIPPLARRTWDDAAVVTALAAEGLAIGASSAFTRALVLDLPWVTDATYEDLVLAARAFLQRAILYWPEPLVRWREGTGISSRPSSFDPDYLARLTYAALIQRRSDLHHLGRTDLLPTIDRAIERWAIRCSSVPSSTSPEPSSPEVPFAAADLTHLPPSPTALPLSSSGVSPTTPVSLPTPSAAEIPYHADSPPPIRVGLLTRHRLIHAIYCLRLYMPLSALSPHVEFTIVDLFTPEALERFDLFILQRDYARPETEMQRLLESGKPILLDLDDLLPELPPTHPEYSRYSEALLPLRALLLNPRLSGIITTNASLASRLAAISNVRVIERFANHLPSSWIDALPAPSVPSSRSGKVRIGFVGTVGHLRDIAMIEGALLRLLQRYGDAIEIVLWVIATDALKVAEGVRFIPAGAADYWGYLQLLAEYAFDIGLAPLEDTPFNRCKSDIKWVEYGAVGAAAVVSDIGVYEEAKALGLALAVPNTTEAWFSALSYLIDHPDVRQNLAQRARDYIRRERIVERHARAYAEILNRFLPPHRRIPPDLTPAAIPIPTPEESFLITEEVAEWRRRRTLQEAGAELLAERLARRPPLPLLTIVTVTPAEQIPLLAETAESLAAQFYTLWRWIVIADTSCADPLFTEHPNLAWVTVETLAEPHSVAATFNLLLNSGHLGEAVALLPPGVRFDPPALALIADALQTHPEAAALYTDHDHWRAHQRLRPWLKPDFDLDRLYGHNYIGAALWLRTAALTAIGGLRPFPGAEYYDALLRLAEHNAVVYHLPEPLLTLPEPEADQEKAPARIEVRRAALREHLSRLGVAAEVKDGLYPPLLWLDRPLAPYPKVSVIVALADVFHLAVALLRSLFSHTEYPDWELILVAHRISDPDLLSYLDECFGNAPVAVRLLRDDGEYALARLYHQGALAATGEILTFLHTDTEIRDPLWLRRLAAEAVRPEVGAVGPMLLQPEFGWIDSAGLYLGGAPDLWATHRPAHRGMYLRNPGYLFEAHLLRQVSALSSVGLTTRRLCYEAVGGFDFLHFPNTPFEVDYCLRLRACGWRVLYQPLSRLIHHGGAVLPRRFTTLLAQITHREHIRAAAEQLVARWGPLLGDDPYAARHLSFETSVPSIDRLYPIPWQRFHRERVRALGFAVRGGSGEYRVRDPFRGLTARGWVQAEVISEVIPRPPTVTELLRLEPDIILNHQRLGPTYEEHLAAWRRALPHLKILFGMDDRLDAVPKKSSFYQLARRTNLDARAKVRRILALSDRAIVSTAPIAELVRELYPTIDIRIIPNALPRERWEPLWALRSAASGDKPRVGWVGAMQHRGDLELLIPVIEATRDEVDWVFMGMWLPEFEHLIREKHRWVDFERYPATLASLNLDLAVAPLEQHEFNEGKSNLRLLEYGAVGYPVLCTDITPYRTDDPPVTRLPNKPDLWIDAIRTKIRDRDALRREGERLRAWVFSRYLLEHTLPLWNDALVA
ncbi:MAG: glycosyltransferase [Hydrogenophilus sp.]|nr:glycosyltransferase [Hydrogenophilus sp.]